MKKCTQCKQELEVDKFYGQVQRGKNGQSWPYYDSMCKECRIIYNTNRRRDVKLQAITYKGGKCIDCGLVDDPCVFDFHHRDPSKKEIAFGKSSKGLHNESVMEELDKCDLLCANCHRKRHANELGF